MRISTKGQNAIKLMLDLATYSVGEPVKLKDIRIGDVFLRAGSPGHVLMVVDTAKNKEGKTAFLLAQGYMPAQNFHVLKNRGDDPWYYEDDVDYSDEKKVYSIGSEILERPEY